MNGYGNGIGYGNGNGDPAGAPPEVLLDRAIKLLRFFDINLPSTTTVDNFPQALDLALSQAAPIVQEARPVLMSAAQREEADMKRWARREAWEISGHRVR
jgi:hypothetical protein